MHFCTGNFLVNILSHTIPFLSFLLSSFSPLFPPFPSLLLYSLPILSLLLVVTTAHHLLSIIISRMHLRRLQTIVKHLKMSSSSSTATDEVLLESINGKGVITLNRPKALNSLNLSMIRAITPKLKVCEQSHQH